MAESVFLRAHLGVIRELGTPAIWICGDSIGPVFELGH
jgi:hypothetical protein